MSPSRTKAAGLSDSDNSDDEQQAFALDDNQVNNLTPHPTGTEERRGLWTPEEDQLLVDLYMKEGPQRWPQIANQIPGRNYKQCCERWHNHVNPDIRKGDWTEMEYRVIVEAYHTLGNNWTQISKLLPGRTGFSVKSHWKGSLKRKVENYLKSMGRIDPNKEMKSYTDFKQVYMDTELTNEDYDGIVGYLRKNIIAMQRRNKKEQDKAAATSSTSVDQESDAEAQTPKKKLKREPVVWTKEEDDNLRAAVTANPSMDWLIISLNVPGKSVFNCRHRWLRHLNPVLKKGHWTNEEDLLLVKLINEMGPKYTEIAAHLAGRTGKQCRNRWLMTLSPSVTKDPFTEEEYRTIITLKKEMGNHWKQICKALPNRTGGAIGNHFHNYMMRKLAVYLKINDMANYGDFEEVFARTELTEDVLSGMVQALKSGMSGVSSRGHAKAYTTGRLTGASSSSGGGRVHLDSSDSEEEDAMLVGGQDSMDDLDMESDAGEGEEDEVPKAASNKPKPVKKMRGKDSAYNLESADADAEYVLVPSTVSGGAGTKRKAAAPAAGKSAAAAVEADAKKKK